MEQETLQERAHLHPDVKAEIARRQRRFDQSRLRTAETAAVTRRLSERGRDLLAQGRTPPLPLGAKLMLGRAVAPDIAMIWVILTG